MSSGCSVCSKLHPIPFTVKVWNNPVTFIYPKGLQIPHLNQNCATTNLHLTFIDQFNVYLPLKSAY